MHKFFIIPLFLWACSASAGLEAIGIQNVAPSQQSYCFNDGIWDNSCANPLPEAIQWARQLFYSKDTQELVAIGQGYPPLSFTVSCRSSTAKDWESCSPSNIDPNFPQSEHEQFYAHDGKGSFMVVATHPDFGGPIKLYAACRDASGEWTNCSPDLYNEKFRKVHSIAYGDGQWMILGSVHAIEGDNGKEAKVHNAFCMDAKTQVWTNCSKTIQYTPATAYGLPMNGLVYLDNEDLWIATSTGVTDASLAPEKQTSHFLVSLCIKSSDPIARDCSGDEVLPSGYYNSHLAKNNKGDLLLISQLDIGESLESSILFCRAPNATWKNCTGNLPQSAPNPEGIEYRYVRATSDDENNWVLIGSLADHASMSKFSYSTAIGKNGDWTMFSQEMPSAMGYPLTDVCFID